MGWVCWPGETIEEGRRKLGEPSKAADLHGNERLVVSSRVCSTHISGLLSEGGQGELRPKGQASLLHTHSYLEGFAAGAAGTLEMCAESQRCFRMKGARKGRENRSAHTVSKEGGEKFLLSTSKIHSR